MNYCHRCHSSYAQPGSCNCFAPDQPRRADPPSVPYPAPSIPMWEPYKYYFTYPDPVIPPFEVTCGTTDASSTNVELSPGEIVQSSDNFARSWE